MRLAAFFAFTAALASTATASLLRRQIEAGLGPHLSPGASLYYPGSEGFEESNERFTLLNSPDFQIAVRPAVEGDVVETVRYCNANNITFLAKSGGHGLSAAFSHIRHAVLIDMRGLNYTRYDAENSQVTVGGGITTGELVNATYAVGKEITAGSCPCTGAVGVTMGGGVGRLMGRHGLLIDNVVSYRFVLANGTLITVDETSDPELWWGIRGAGQTLGIATEVTYNVYDQVNDGMHFAVDMEFRMDQLQDILSVMNTVSGGQDGLNPNNAIFLVTVSHGGGHWIAINWVWSGPRAEAQEFLQPWLDLTPTFYSDRIVSWASLPWRVSSGLNSELCTPNKYRNSYSLSMDRYDPEGMQRYVDQWEEFDNLYGANVTFNLIFETFAQEAVSAVDVNSTAYRWRGGSRHFGIFQATYTDPAFSTLADDWTIQNEKLFNEDTGYDSRHVYFNYAKGNYISLEEMFGNEGQVERLQALKQRYDPLGRFNGMRDLMDST